MIYFLIFLLRGVLGSHNMSISHRNAYHQFNDVSCQFTILDREEANYFHDMVLCATKINTFHSMKRIFQI